MAFPCALATPRSSFSSSLDCSSDLAASRARGGRDNGFPAPAPTSRTSMVWRSIPWTCAFRRVPSRSKRLSTAPPNSPTVPRKRVPAILPKVPATASRLADPKSTSSPVERTPGLSYRNTSTSPACNRRSAPSILTRSRPSSSIPSATPCSSPTRTLRPFVTSRALNSPIMPTSPSASN